MSRILSKFLNSDAVTTDKVTADAITGDKILIPFGQQLRLRNEANTFDYWAMQVLTGLDAVVFPSPNHLRGLLVDATSQTVIDLSGFNQQGVVLGDSMPIIGGANTPLVMHGADGIGGGAQNVVIRGGNDGDTGAGGNVDISAGSSDAGTLGHITFNDSTQDVLKIDGAVIGGAQILNALPIVFNNTGNTNYTSIKAFPALGASYDLILPDDAPNDNEILQHTTGGQLIFRSSFKAGDGTLSIDVGGRALYDSTETNIADFATAGVFSLNTNTLKLNATITAGGTTGAQTIDKISGTVNFATAATSLVVTNSFVTANSIVIATVRTNDTTLQSVQCVCTAGSFTMYANAAATAETSVGFFVLNS
jgi:hypothetical protein